MEDYTSDLVSRKATVAGIIAAGLGGGAFVLLAWFVLRLTSLPAFTTSNVTLALATAGTVATIVVVGVLITLWLLDEQRAPRWWASKPKALPAAEPDAELEIRRPRWRVVLTYLVSYLSPAALMISTTAIPLSATRLYLDGVQVDQVFRTQFLTRMATTWSNADMNYLDLPSYYPLGWFWGGGRLANLLGISGWEVYQPWAMISIAAAACMLVPIWQRLTGSLAVATGIALVSMCVVLVMSPEEPYGAIVALGAPAAALLARRALLGSWFSSVALTLYLGFSATMYTLFTGAVAVSVVVIALIFTLLHSRTLKPLLHLTVIGFGSIFIALVAWGPYLWMVVTGHPHSASTAPDYLPLTGAQIPLPFLAPSIIGLLCLIGLVYLLLRIVDQDVQAMAIALFSFYLWALASMVATLIGTTLLGFRIDMLIVLQLSTAGVLALAELRLVGISRLYPDRFSAKVRRSMTTIMVIILCASGVHYAQNIPIENQTAIDHAYTNTDGFGERADRYAPDAGRYYAEINEEISAQGYVTEDTVMLTDEFNLMAFNPYLGFQGFTSHYANPLGEFEERNSTIQGWADGSWDELSEPADFLGALEQSPWRAPDVFVLRGDLEDQESGWQTHLSEDIYPSNPNIRYRAIQFNPDVFLDSPQEWKVSQIGPFVVATRVNP
ncbi:hypothetical protein C5L39_10135 [Corynebacterium alimapuense]|uniref:Galactan 5-O-arabinofuranosyltransferase n=2 Tax=Corynebacterium alimapuense TaxID=1576874 RepID=A0A3M8K5Y5_9CORY|nr:hypothetical protein C5L39_10135 [Corynebacterium alimapuense]